MKPYATRARISRCLKLFLAGGLPLVAFYISSTAQEGKSCLPDKSFADVESLIEKREYRRQRLCFMVLNPAHISYQSSDSMLDGCTGRPMIPLTRSNFSRQGKWWFGSADVCVRYRFSRL